jgi:hypothetical protein
LGISTGVRIRWNNGDIPRMVLAEGFWKADIDRKGSDLAHRPSENAPTNCDSSGSEKSKDSPRTRGV